MRCLRRSRNTANMTLEIVPCELSEANAFVAQHHRHHKPVVGHRFSLAVSDGQAVRGVAIVGRPIARMLDDGETLEVTRVATDGAINACSALYAACWRAARAMGYRRLVTYILDTELGTSVRAAEHATRELARGIDYTKCAALFSTATLPSLIRRKPSITASREIAWCRFHRESQHAGFRGQNENARELCLAQQGDSPK